MLFPCGRHEIAACNARMQASQAREVELHETVNVSGACVKCEHDSPRAYSSKPTETAVRPVNNVCWME